jgi:MCP family monocarboxylic acid transporter-like MFS transporter 14
VSALSNRYGFRVVTIMGAILGSISLAVSVFATSIEFLYISIGVVGGIGFGLVYVPAVVAVGYYFDKRRALATGIAVCGSGVGTFVIAPLTTWLLEQYGWRGTILMLVIIFFPIHMIAVAGTTWAVTLNANQARYG